MDDYYTLSGGDNYHGGEILGTSVLYYPTTSITHELSDLLEYVFYSYSQAAMALYAYSYSTGIIYDSFDENGSWDTRKFLGWNSEYQEVWQTKNTLTATAVGTLPTLSQEVASWSSIAPCTTTTDILELFDDSYNITSLATITSATSHWGDTSWSHAAFSVPAGFYGPITPDMMTSSFIQSAYTATQESRSNDPDGNYITFETTIQTGAQRIFQYQPAYIGYGIGLNAKGIIVIHYPNSGLNDITYRVGETEGYNPVSGFDYSSTSPGVMVPVQYPDSVTSFNNSSPGSHGYTFSISNESITYTVDSVSFDNFLPVSEVFSNTAFLPTNLAYTFREHHTFSSSTEHISLLRTPPRYAYGGGGVEGGFFPGVYMFTFPADLSGTNHWEVQSDTVTLEQGYYSWTIFDGTDTKSSSLSVQNDTYTYEFRGINSAISYGKTSTFEYALHSGNWLAISAGSYVDNRLSPDAVWGLYT